MYGYFTPCRVCGGHDHYAPDLEDHKPECVVHLQERVASLEKTRDARPLAYADAVHLMVRARNRSDSASSLVEWLNTAGVFLVRVDKPD